MKRMILTNLKMDKRKKYILVVDTETTGEINFPLVYDIAWRLIDKKGNIYKERAFLVKEIFCKDSLMDKAYYNYKIPVYKSDFVKREVCRWKDIIETLKQDLEIADTVTAYNLGFDTRAIKSTCKYLKYSETVSPIETFEKEKICIWQIAVQLLCTRKSYKDFCEKHNFLTASKKYYDSSAETVYKYLVKCIRYQEWHLALEDVHIEIDILLKCLRQRKKLDKDPNKRYNFSLLKVN